MSKKSKLFQAEDVTLQGVQKIKKQNGKPMSQRSHCTKVTQSMKWGKTANRPS